MPDRLVRGCWPLLYELPQRTEFDLQFMDVLVIAVHFYNAPGNQIAAQDNQSKIENAKGNNQVQHAENIIIFGGGDQKSDHGQRQGQHSYPGSHNSQGCSFFRQEQLYLIDDNGVKFSRIIGGLSLRCQ